MADEIREFTIRMDSGLHRAIKVHCALHGLSMNAFINEALLERVGAESASDLDLVFAGVREDYRETLDILAK